MKNMKLKNCANLGRMQCPRDAFTNITIMNYIVEVIALVSSLKIDHILIRIDPERTERL